MVRSDSTYATEGTEVSWPGRLGPLAASARRSYHYGMDQFKVTIDKQQVCFAAAHFIAYGSGKCENLHGHNYRVGAVFAGELDQYHLLVDFVRLKRAMEEIAETLDHRMLLATRSDALPVSTTDAGEVQVVLADRRYVFPAGDVALLDVPNTTAEMLAAWFIDRLLGELGEDAHGLSWLEIEIEESPGQSASCRRDLAT
jgi:6-pyruvoyl tetrahydropterin synthase/QueD family protein